jgi:hypothetical protein
MGHVSKSAEICFDGVLRLWIHLSTKTGRYSWFLIKPVWLTFIGRPFLEKKTKNLLFFLKNDKSTKSIDNLTKSIDTKPNDKSFWRTKRKSEN